MMRSTISNSTLSVSVDSLGAELASIKSSSGTEYLWQGDPDIWSGRAPVLFPIVGALKNGEYQLDGQTYSMNQHGFARRMEFELIEESADTLCYKLGPTDETKKSYPFDFELIVKFALCDNHLEVIYIVKNNDNKPMPFSIGAHPGFSLAWGDNDKVEDYYLEFSEKETADSKLLDDNSLLSNNSEPTLQDETRLNLTKTMFDRNALILSNLNSDSITLRSNIHNNSLTVKFAGFPDLGIWAKPGAPYVCIEPWYGHVDPAGHDGNINNKPGIIALHPSTDFICSHSIIVKE